MNRPPWLKTRSTGAEVQGVQKMFSNKDFKQANCLLSLTRRHGVPTSVPSRICCTYARYELTTLVSGTAAFAVDSAGLRYEAKSEVLGTLAGGGHDPESRESPAVSATGAGMSSSLTLRAAARIQSTKAVFLSVL